MKKLSAVERYRCRRARRLDARGIRLDKWGDEGQWITTKNGHHVHLNEEGVPDKGNRSVVNLMKSGHYWYGTDRKVDITPKLPKVKNGAKYSATMNSCGKGAIEDGFGKKLKKVVADVKPSDVVYQKQPNGETVASIPGLAAKIDNRVKFKDQPAKSKEVQAIYDKAKRAEPKISKDMVELSNELGANMSGLEFSMKGGSHFAEKIDRKRGKEKDRNPNFNETDEQIAEKLTDTVRYTMMSKHEDIAKNTLNIIDGLEKKGYKIDSIENKFFGENGKQPDYKAIHLDISSPDGQKFELQIHSDETMRVKNINHKIYEKTEGKDGIKRSEEEKTKLKQEMIDNASKIPDPPGIVMIKSTKKKK